MLLLNKFVKSNTLKLDNIHVYEINGSFTFNINNGYFMMGKCHFRLLKYVRKTYTKVIWSFLDTVTTNKISLETIGTHRCISIDLNKKIPYMASIIEYFNIKDVICHYKKLLSADKKDIVIRYKIS